MKTQTLKTQTWAIALALALGGAWTLASAHGGDGDEAAGPGHMPMMQQGGYGPGYMMPGGGYGHGPMMQQGGYGPGYMMPCGNHGYGPTAQRGGYGPGHMMPGQGYGPGPATPPAPGAQAQ